MNVRFKKRANDRKLSAKVKQVIKQIDEAEHTHQISNLKKLKSPGSYYRIRSGDYRIGLIIDGDTLILCPDSCSFFGQFE